ncbi:MAG: hypothetical protein IJE46_06085 [Clostridia bacterium]|nr:hypothetical protein [Clostridia bacterium]
MICCDKCITVFSFNGRAYERSFFDGVSIFGYDGISTTDAGFEQNNKFKITIPATESISIKPGDRVVLGNSEVLDYENAYTVISVKDNRCSSDYLKHYLIEIK